jgi:aminoglycoside 3-N-acetyltransferase
MIIPIIRKAKTSLTFRAQGGWQSLSRAVRHLRRRVVRIDESEVKAALNELGDFRADILLVHSSLSGCGQLVGGAAMVVEVLESWIGPRALVMPTHTYCYPGSDGKAPVYDSCLTGSLVGAITDYFWRQPGVVRSTHPTHSLACRGQGSAEICAGHDLCDTPCGMGTPYEKLVTRDTAVLMFAATMNTYTLFHTAEDAAHVPYLYEPKLCCLSLRSADGSVKPFPMRRQNMRVPRAFQEMAVWLQERSLLVRRELGRGELLFIPDAARVHKLIVQEMRKDPCFLVAHSARAGLTRTVQKEL